jgi:hypothetical protein
MTIIGSGIVQGRIPDSSQVEIPDSPQGNRVTRIGSGLFDDGDILYGEDSIYHAISGYSGYSGFSGYIGGVGISGYSGYSGFSGSLNQLTIPSVDLDYNGIVVSADIESSAGFGTPLFVGSDGYFRPANATTDDTCPCVVLALDSGTGFKNILLYGVVRNNAWSWAVGPGVSGLIFLNISTGTLTQTRPVGTDQVIQIAGWAVPAIAGQSTTNIMMFAPQLNYITHT